MGCPKSRRPASELVRRSQEKLKAPEPYHRGMRYHTDTLSARSPREAAAQENSSVCCFDGVTLKRLLDEPKERATAKNAQP